MKLKRKEGDNFIIIFDGRNHEWDNVSESSDLLKRGGTCKPLQTRVKTSSVDPHPTVTGDHQSPVPTTICRVPHVLSGMGEFV